MRSGRSRSESEDGQVASTDEKPRGVRSAGTAKSSTPREVHSRPGEREKGASAEPLGFGGRSSSQVRRGYSMYQTPVCTLGATPTVCPPRINT